MVNRIGKKYGRLTVTALVGRAHGGSLWECVCECGNKKVVHSGNLPRTRSCGCLEKETRGQSQRVDIQGQIFGRLTAVRDIGADPKGQGRIWEFRCSCGNTLNVHAKAVRYGRTKSCGCLHRENAATLAKKYADKINEGLAVRLTVPLDGRFWRHVDLENRPEPVSCKGFGSCLLWIGGKDTRGRAQMGVGTTTKRASHVAWFLEYGVWPDFLCHRCDDPTCVNVDHLFEGDDDSNRYDRTAKELGGIQIP